MKCVCVQGGGPVDAKLSIMFTDTTHSAGLCSAPGVEKPSPFRWGAHSGSHCLHSRLQLFKCETREHYGHRSTIVLLLQNSASIVCYWHKIVLQKQPFPSYI